jgi:hypothetical protein
MAYYYMYGAGYDGTGQVAMLNDKNITTFRIYSGGVLDRVVIDGKYTYQADRSGMVQMDMNVILRDKFKNDKRFFWEMGDFQYYNEEDERLVWGLPKRTLTVQWIDKNGNNEQRVLTFDKVIRGQVDYGGGYIYLSPRWISTEYIAGRFYHYGNLQRKRIFDTIIVMLPTYGDYDKIRAYYREHTGIITTREIDGSRSRIIEVVSTDKRRGFDLIKLEWLKSNGDVATSRNIPENNYNCAGVEDLNRFITWQGFYGESKNYPAILLNKRIERVKDDYLDTRFSQFTKPTYVINEVFQNRMTETKEVIELGITVEREEDLTYFLDLPYSQKIWYSWEDEYADEWRGYQYKLITKSFSVGGKTRFKIILERPLLQLNY